MSKTGNGSGKGGEGPLQSKLSEGSDRFLSQVIEKGLENGDRTAEDFLRHFTPSMIMTALEDQSLVRARILVATTGIKHKIATKKSAASAADDLQIALDEKETDPKIVIDNFSPDERVEYLDRRLLWAYVTESNFWESGREDIKAFESAKSYMAFMLDQALHEELLTHQDIIENISIQKISELLPRAILELVLDSVLTAGRSGRAFSDKEFMNEVPANMLVEYIPLPHLWERVVVPRIAETHGYTKGTSASLPVTIEEEPRIEPEAVKPSDDDSKESNKEDTAAVDSSTKTKDKPRSFLIPKRRGLNLSVNKSAGRSDGAKIPSLGDKPDKEVKAKAKAKDDLFDDDLDIDPITDEFDGSDAIIVEGDDSSELQGEVHTVTDADLRIPDPPTRSKR